MVFRLRPVRNRLQWLIKVTVAGSKAAQDALREMAPLFSVDAMIISPRPWKIL
jgi:hypothetical protein